MHYLQNHIWCSESNWGCHYDCRHLVSLSAFREGFTEDWEAIVDESADKFLDQSDKDRCEEFYRLRGYAMPDDSVFTRDVPNLRPEVLDWLEENVEDRKGWECGRGWCIGSTKYRATDKFSLTVFFHRRSDAMAFIRTWSKWKKPINYCQYFTDVRKRLNLDTLKYEEA